MNKVDKLLQELCYHTPSSQAQRSHKIAHSSCPHSPLRLNKHTLTCVHLRGKAAPARWR